MSDEQKNAAPVGAVNDSAQPGAAGKGLERQPRVKSGAYARSATAMKIRADKTRRLLQRIRATCPWITETDLPTLRAFCELEVVGAALFAGIVQAGAISAVKGDVAARRLVEDHRKNRLAAHTLANALGLSPLARQQIKARAADDAIDIVARMAAGGDNGDDS